MLRHLVAIDIGSNSFHLVIAREQDGSLQILHKEKQSVQLADGLDKNNVLSDAAIARGVACLTKFNQRFSSLPEAQVRIVATHTLRVATNKDVFIQAAKQCLDYPIEIIEGEEEARLIYNGVIHTKKLNANSLVIDIGGGSTEVILGTPTASEYLASLVCGCVSYKELFFVNGDITQDAFKKAQQQAELLFAKLPPQILFSNQHPTVLGSSGTIKAISSTLFELYDDNKITLIQLKKLKQYLIECGHIDNIKLNQIDEKRIPVLASGLAILLGFFKQLRISKLTFTSGALREGVLYEMAAIDEHQDIQKRTISSISKLYHIDQSHANKVKKTALELLHQAESVWDIDKYTQLLKTSAQLHEIGIHINFKSHPKHGAYIISNINMPGFEPEQIKLLTFLILNQKRKPDLELIEDLPLEEQTAICQILALLRLAILFNLGRLPRNLIYKKIIVNNNQLQIILPKNLTTSLLQLDLEQEQLNLEAIGIKMFW